jgi:ubiquinone/menaquinone biosynthesis C-methylase UbiE
MNEPVIRFDDGAAYELFMGKWSQLAGETFLQWLSPSKGLRWVDVGCGNGAFTQMIVDQSAPAKVDGIDPSPEQLQFARDRFTNAPVTFQQGDAMALPYADDAFDAVVMALVIFFVPDPAKGVSEMARVVKPGGLVCSYAWDIFGGGFPFDAIYEEMAALGTPALWPPSTDASRIDVMTSLWEGAGLTRIETLSIKVQRTFTDFEDFWTIARSGPRLAPRISAMSPNDLNHLKERVRRRLPHDAEGQLTIGATANSIKGFKR